MTNTVELIAEKKQLPVEGLRAPIDVLPIPLVLCSEHCKAHHMDEGEWTTKWHKTHLCATCGKEWTPYPFPTVGVASVHTRSPAAEIDRWRAARWSYLEGLDWDTIDAPVHDAVYRYLLRSLARGRVPSMMIVIDALRGITPVPQCGYLNCFTAEEHVH